MAATVEPGLLPPINAQSSEAHGIYAGKYIDRSPFLTSVRLLRSNANVTCD